MRRNNDALASLPNDTMPLRNAENQVPPLYPSKRRASEGSVPQEDDAEYWKNMYFALQQQRVTEPEEQLIAFCQESEKREASLKALIQHVETQVNDLKVERKESEVKIKGMEDIKATLEETKTELEHSANDHGKTGKGD